jgi:phosphate starvation-inducible PhoH-like protein
MAKHHMKKNKNKAKDQSPYVYQDDKFKGKLQFKNKIQWTEKQKKFIDLVSNKEVKLIFIKGPAGSSKSILAVYAALLMLDQKKVSEIMYVRSAVESSESKMGYLPGTNEEKMAFYNLPFEDKLHELLPSNDVESLKKQQKVSCFSTNFARGMSWNAKAIIMDEAQNSSRKEIVTILTRLGQFSRCFVLADPLQTDLAHGKGGGFEEIFQLFNNEESREKGIYTFEFGEEDIMRSELVRYLVKKFNQLPTKKI